MANNKPTVPTTEDIQHVKFLAATYGSQIVRRDNKFYDIEHLGTPLSRVDVEMKILNLIAEEHPNLPLNNGMIKSLFKLLIDTRHTDRARSFQVWSGATICEPGNPNRIVMKRGTVSANTWSEPEYRSLKVNSADLDVVGEFFDQFFQHQKDREAFLNWTAWGLQNEGDKPACPAQLPINIRLGKARFLRIPANYACSSSGINKRQEGIPKGSASFSSTTIVGLRTPRSTPLT